MRIVLVIAVAAMACSKKAPPSCDEMTKQVRSLYDARDPTLIEPDDVIDSFRLPFGCKKLDDRKRTCIMAAKSFTDLYACDGRRAVYVEPKDFIDIASQSSPGPIGPFAKATFDEKQTIRDIDPRLCAEASIIPAWCEYTTPEFPNAKFRIFRDPYLERDDNWPLGTIRVTLPGNGVKEKLTAKWGPPRESDGNVYWYNTKTRVRVAMHPAKIPNDPPGSVDLDYSGFIPLTELIGDDKNLFGFEGGKPLLGASARAVEKRYGLRAGLGRIKLFPTELGDAVTEIILGSALDTEMPETVEGYQIEFRGTEVVEVARLLESKYGAPQDGEDGEAIYRDSPHVELYRKTLIVGVIDGP